MRHVCAFFFLLFYITTDLKSLRCSLDVFDILSNLVAIRCTGEGVGGAGKKGSNLPRTEEKLDEVRLGSAERGGEEEINS